MPKKKRRRAKGPRGKGYEIVCPQCGESCHETTRHFNPNKEADGIMLQNKREFTAAHDQAWDEPMQGGGSGPLVCLMCDGALAPSGNLLVKKLGAPAPSGPAEDVEDKEPEAKVSVDEGQQDQPDTFNICPKCRTVVIAAEGDKVAVCPTHGEIPLEELVSTETKGELPPELTPGAPAEVKEDEPPNVALGEVVQKVDEEAFLCKDCKTPFKTRQALSAHGRWCKKK